MKVESELGAELIPLQAVRYTDRVFDEPMREAYEEEYSGDWVRS
jgi:hypothetical protein